MTANATDELADVEKPINNNNNATPDINNNLIISSNNNNNNNNIKANNSGGGGIDSTSKESTTAGPTTTTGSSTTNASNTEDIFQIAAKAEKLLQEILSSNRLSNKIAATQLVKQEPVLQNQIVQPQQQQNQHQQQSAQPQQTAPQPHYVQNGNVYYTTNQVHMGYYQQSPIHGQMVPMHQPAPVNMMNNGYAPSMPPQAQYIYPPTGPGPGTQPNGVVDPAYYMKHPPPMVQQTQVIQIPTNQPPVASAQHNQAPYFYQIQQHHPSQPPHHPQPPFYHHPHSHPHPHHHLHHLNYPYTNSPVHIQQLTPVVSPQLVPPPFQHSPYAAQAPPMLNQFSYANHNMNKNHPNNYNNNNNNNNSFYLKRKFGEINNCTNSNGSSTSGYSSTSLTTSNTPTSTNQSESKIHNLSESICLNEEEDLNLMRERELKDLKCKSVVEKMSVFLKYYQQFKEAYIHRVQTIECSDSLKIQFHSLIKYLNEYESLLAELDVMITDHERDRCKNNHRKTKKFFNKTKAFIRYECNKRLQSNIFEYRRLINSQDRYAGMYDLLDMNSYLISLLPDIGVSIRRYINRCEKAREQEQLEEEDIQAWHSENSNDSTINESNGVGSGDVGGGDGGGDLTIPTFKEFIENETELTTNENSKRRKIDASSDIDDNSNASAPKSSSELERKETQSTSSSSHRSYESFSKGIDSLNRYLLKRVDEEESLDELVKERIIKWINKRQAKYILIFSEVDKLLNQHKSGECYPKFHSYLLFNLGKLVTVCDSYHQKLKELLYSTTIRRKKKRKKVKLLPESMTDVFSEINDLKRALEYSKLHIKKCNEHKNLIAKEAINNKPNST